MKSRALSADVNGAIDPDFQEVHEKRNAARLGYGLCLTKFTGSGGKYSANDANAEYVGWLRNLFKKSKVTAGFEFSYGYKNDEQQIVNFNDAVEFNPETGDALLGPVDNNAYLRYYGINLYISATLNFINNDK